MRSRPDVALISLYPPPGRTHAGRSGVASYTANLARALGRAGARVVVIAQNEPGVPTVVREGRVRIERRFRRGAAALPEASRAACATGAAVVHLQQELFLYGGSSSVAWLLPSLLRLRAAGRGPVVTMHQVVDPQGMDGEFLRAHRVPVPGVWARAGASALQEGVRRLAETVLVHEPAFARLVPGSVVVPHGVEGVETPDRTAARRALGLDERLTALCFGYLAPYKGLEIALEAGEMAQSAVQIVVVGGEHPRFADVGYAEDLRRRWPSARFTGPVDERDIPTWFAAADVVLLPYPRPFSSSGALALALGYGTPPLLSGELLRCVEAPEELEIPLTPERLAAALRDLASHPAARERLRAAASQLARGRSWTTVARRHLEIYEEARHGTHPARRSLRAG